MDSDDFTITSSLIRDCLSVSLSFHGCSVAQSYLTLCDPMDLACQASLPMDFSRQEYWNGLPFSPPGDIPDPDIKSAAPASPELAGRFFTTVS